MLEATDRAARGLFASAGVDVWLDVDIFAAAGARLEAEGGRLAGLAPGCSCLSVHAARIDALPAHVGGPGASVAAPAIPMVAGLLHGLADGDEGPAGHVVGSLAGRDVDAAARRIEAAGCEPADGGRRNVSAARPWRAADVAAGVKKAEWRTAVEGPEDRDPAVAAPKIEPALERPVGIRRECGPIEAVDRAGPADVATPEFELNPGKAGGLFIREHRAGDGQIWWTPHDQLEAKVPLDSPTQKVYDGRHAEGTIA